MALDGTYTGLQASVAAFLDRTDLTAVIPDFITIAEGALNRSIRVRRMVTVGTLSISASYTNLPADFLEERSLTVDTDPPLDLVYETQDTLDEVARTMGATYTATPRMYGIVGVQMRVLPVPDQTYTGSFTYFQKLPALATAGANWLLTAYPDAYLYGALVSAAPYLQDDERIQVWSTLYTSALQGIRHNETERVGRRMKGDPALLGRTRNRYNINNDWVGVYP